MEKLSIKNFLTINELDMELKRINIFIGPQAQGKSIIAKLIKFFKEMPYVFSSSIAYGDRLISFEEEQLIKFNRMFPKQYWLNSIFSIKYSSKYFSINLSKKSINGNLEIEFSDEIHIAEKLARTFKNELLKAEERIINEDETTPGIISRRMRWDEVRKCFINNLFNECNKPTVDRVFYIPAGRSFLLIYKKYFSFINSDIKVDYFLTEFGSVYEGVKDLINNSIVKNNTPDLVNKYFEFLINGKYITEDGEDWIVGKKGKVNVVNSSSGQQEALPMALVMSVWPYLETNSLSKSFIIEEPEAHLFPSAQGAMTSLIANAYNYNNSTSIIITTHSPYILSALNVSIQAKNTIIDNPNNNKKYVK
ncbi:hypothetical protein UA45_01445 [Morganella morganii]|uniref:Endonuclease GajA/Old nuclease/RecF-like AAA domain-containing protein n=1 Tax=Morganella morganii TaxID=582 RepID=A0A0D8LEH9_MORMO|nr:hypothetical protein UA45_01445 [Morganella morganii]